MTGKETEEIFENFDESKKIYIFSFLFLKMIDNKI
jgi:hypothetical protein